MRPLPSLCPGPALLEWPPPETQQKASPVSGLPFALMRIIQLQNRYTLFLLAGKRRLLQTGNQSTYLCSIFKCRETCSIARPELYSSYSDTM